MHAAAPVPGQLKEAVMTDIPYRTALIVGAGPGISASLARGLPTRLPRASRGGRARLPQSEAAPREALAPTPLESLPIAKPQHRTTDAITPDEVS
jgi:hypothetical protein